MSKRIWGCQMTKMKRLTQPTDAFLNIIPPITEKELQEREKDYHMLTPSRMALKSNEQAYRPTAFIWKGKTTEIQVNHCANPFCKNHGLPQERFDIKSKPRRYKIVGNEYDKRVKCNLDRVEPDSIPTLFCESLVISNWSLAEEIERLVRINSVLPLEPDYTFHKPSCPRINRTPFENEKEFYKRGKSSSGGQKYQCKECKKITSTLPNKSKNTSYNQKLNHKLPMFAKLLVNRTPVASTCNSLEIGRKTYYTKLEWLYRCCLEFLNTRETKALEKKTFDRMWLNTDAMQYNLNNVRRKGMRKSRGSRKGNSQLQTNIIITADNHSRYVFGSDVSYDFDIDFKQISFDTSVYKDDHLYNFLSKNAKYGRYFAFPMKPTPNDTESMGTYEAKLKEFKIRADYVNGLHVNNTYTAMARFWLIKNQVNAKKWRITTDDDKSFKTAFSRIFMDEIKRKKAYHFLCRVDKNLSLDDAYAEYVSSIIELKDWAEDNKFEYNNLREVARVKLEKELITHKFHETLHTPLGEVYHKYAKNQIDHPMGMKDRGQPKVDVVTDMSHLSEEKLANLILAVNDNAVNSFIQEIRRSISILERPLVTSRGDGKSYIYANFNPKYAQMAVTILRTYYNFCKPYKTKSRDETPAQRLGIADRVYTWEDIIYKR